MRMQLKILTKTERSIYNDQPHGWIDCSAVLGVGRKTKMDGLEHGWNQRRDIETRVV